MAINRLYVRYWCGAALPQPAKVELNEEGQPARFQAWGRVYVVAEIEGPHWEELLEWWLTENLGRTLEELTVRHYLVRANGVQRSAVAELVQRGTEGWFVDGVED